MAYDRFHFQTNPSVGGETIKDMQNTSSCKINVDQPSGADIDRRIELIGVPSAVEHAKRLIWEKVQTVVSRVRLKHCRGSVADLFPA